MNISASPLMRTRELGPVIHRGFLLFPLTGLVYNLEVIVYICQVIGLERLQYDKQQKTAGALFTMHRCLLMKNL
jgi:hypothetical protein